MVRMAVAFNDQSVAHQQVDPSDAVDVVLSGDGDMPAGEEQPHPRLAARLSRREPFLQAGVPHWEGCQCLACVVDRQQPQIDGRFCNDHRALWVMPSRDVSHAVPDGPHCAPGLRRRIRMEHEPGTASCGRTCAEDDVGSGLRGHPQPMQRAAAQAPQPAAGLDGADDSRIGLGARVPAGGDALERAVPHESVDAMAGETLLAELGRRVDAGWEHTPVVVTRRPDLPRICSSVDDAPALFSLWSPLRAYARRNLHSEKCAVQRRSSPRSRTGAEWVSAPTAK